MSNRWRDVGLLVTGLWAVPSRHMEPRSCSGGSADLAPMERVSGWTPLASPGTVSATPSCPASPNSEGHAAGAGAGHRPGRAAVTGNMVVASSTHVPNGFFQHQRRVRVAGHLRRSRQLVGADGTREVVP